MANPNACDNMTTNFLITPPNMSAQLEPRRFNVTEYYQMAEAGILTPDDRVELIEGEVIKLSPIGSKHAACVSRIIRQLILSLGEKATISPQNPVRLNNFSEPVPDIAVLKRRDDAYAEHHPFPEDVLLLIEVADTSVVKDRNVKVPLYAASGIPEVWLVNIPAQVIEVYRGLKDREYGDCFHLGPGDIAIASQLEECSLLINYALGLSIT
jgi:Uma2 family endonuclease